MIYWEVCGMSDEDDDSKSTALTFGKGYQTQTYIIRH